MSIAEEMLEDRQTLKLLEVMQDKTHVNISFEKNDRLTPGITIHCDQESKSSAQRFNDDTDKPPTFSCYDARNLRRKDEDETDGEAIFDAQVNCSGLGLTADKRTRELVQANSHQFIRGGPSTDSSCMQMTQEPTFDYFSQVSHRVGLANLSYPKTVVSHQALCCHN